jgi:uncharacterized Zn finger protein
MARKAKCQGCNEPWEFVSIVVECEEGPARMLHCEVCGFIASLELLDTEPVTMELARIA